MSPGRIISIKPVKWLLSLTFLILLAYFNFFLERSSFAQLIILYTGLFVLYILFVQQRFWPFKGYMAWMMSIAVISRIMLLFSFPNLSDDIYRFIWDGRLTSLGIHPFEYLPSEWMQILEDSVKNNWSALFSQLNSPDYYSVYPPVNQLIFLMATTLFPQSITGAAFVVKAIVIAADLVLIFLLYKATLERHASTMPVLLYALNPLVIIEIAGNLHFEGLMLMFLVLSLYLLLRQKTVFAALAFSGAVLVKLHPLMLLPFFLKFLGWRRGFLFTALSMMVSVGVMVLFLAAGGELPVRWDHFLTSLQLYFQTFEFNAGIYYLIRSIGSWYYGYNPIQVVGQFLFVLNAGILLLLFIRQRRDWTGLVFSITYAYFAYYLFSTTVHPWYILTMLPFALLTGFRTPIIWTAVVVVSYYAYSTADWHENFYLLTLEYTCIFAFLVWEVRTYMNRKQSKKTVIE